MIPGMIGTLMSKSNIIGKTYHKNRTLHTFLTDFFEPKEKCFDVIEQLCYNEVSAGIYFGFEAIEFTAFVD